MKTYLFLLLFVFQAFSLSSQISLKGYNQEKIDPSLFEGRWKARWISYPGEAPNVYGVYHFRKSFDLEVVPSRFIVHVSADNRYKLYVNGKLVSLGPARGDIYNWSFETVDLAPYLNTKVEVLRENALKVNHHLQIFEVSATKGDGMDAWCDWLQTESAKCK
jgi:alpha-L-rhamnosidase